MDEFYGLLSTYPNPDWIAPNLEQIWRRGFVPSIFSQDGSFCFRGGTFPVVVAGFADGEGCNVIAIP